MAKHTDPPKPEPKWDASRALPPDVPGAPLSDESPPPKFGVGKPVDGGGDVPRVCDQLDRAPAGLKRFKIVARNYHPQAIRYILAKTEEDATACYLKVQKLDERLARLKKQAGPKAEDDVEPVDLAITELPD